MSEKSDRARRRTKRETGMRWLASVLATAALLAGTGTPTQGIDAFWPQRPIRLIVPFPAGASTDVIARVIGPKLSQQLGPQIVIANRAGASGNRRGRQGTTRRLYDRHCHREHTRGRVQP